MPMLTKTQGLPHPSSIYASQLCPDDSTVCGPNDTCCQHPNESWACCPAQNAVCCSDGYHCCPQNTVCDLKDFTCKKEGPLKLLSLTKSQYAKEFNCETGGACVQDDGDDTTL